MIAGIEARARHAGSARARRLATRLAAELTNELPAAQVRVLDGDVRIEGRALWLAAACRWPGGLLR